MADHILTWEEQEKVIRSGLYGTHAQDQIETIVALAKKEFDAEEALREAYKGGITYENELTAFTTDDEPFRPEVPKEVRTVVYFAALITGALTTAAAGVSLIWFPEVAGQITATTAVVGGVVTTIAGGLGVVYRLTGGNTGV